MSGLGAAMPGCCTVAFLARRLAEPARWCPCISGRATRRLVRRRRKKRRYRPARITMTSLRGVRLGWMWWLLGCTRQRCYWWRWRLLRPWRRRRCGLQIIVVIKQLSKIVVIKSVLKNLIKIVHISKCLYRPNGRSTKMYYNYVLKKKSGGDA